MSWSQSYKTPLADDNGVHVAHYKKRESYGCWWIIADVPTGAALVRIVRCTRIEAEKAMRFFQRRFFEPLGLQAHVLPWEAASPAQRKAARGLPRFTFDTYIKMRRKCMVLRRDRKGLFRVEQNPNPPQPAGEGNAN